jgi:hypothetical protein
MSKKSSDKNSKSKSANSEKGSVAFVNNGLLKSGFVRFFWSADVDPTSTAKEYVEHYGPSLKCRYVKCTDPEKVLEKLLKECGDKVVVGNLVEYGPKLAMDALKEASGAKQTHVCELQDKKQKEKKEKSKKSKKDDSDEENEDEEDEDNEDEEDDGKKACSDDEVSDAPASDDDEEEEEKPKKNSKKDSKDEEDEEEKPKKSSKKESKGSKSAKNSKKK